VGGLLKAGVGIHCLRDLTRGGLAGALVEIAKSAGVHVTFEETAVPVRQEVQAACEILGLDPLFVANEGRFVCFLPAADAERALAALRSHPAGSGAAVIGRVRRDPAGRVTMKSVIGTSRLVEMLSGEQLPRIC
jgi:hydrogenase expression/formation protein HypE